MSRGDNGILYLCFVYSVIIGRGSNGLSRYPDKKFVGSSENCRSSDSTIAKIRKMKRVIRDDFGFHWKISQNLEKSKLSINKSKSELLNDQTGGRFDVEKSIHLESREIFQEIKSRTVAT